MQITPVNLMHELAEKLGFGQQGRINFHMAALGALGFTTVMVILVVLTPAFEADPLNAGAAEFTYSRASRIQDHYWASDVAAARQSLDVLLNATAVFSALAVLVVAFVLTHQFSWRLAALIVVPACLLSLVAADKMMMSGPVTRFLIDVVPNAAVNAHALAPEGAKTLRYEVLAISALGLSAAFSTAFASIALTFRGRVDGTQPPVLRARWQAIFSIYVLAMITIALMAADTSAVAAFAASPLSNSEPLTGLSDQAALLRLGTTTATYSGTSCAMALVAACLPSFIAVRQDIRQEARAAVASGAAPSEEEWLKKERLDVTLFNGILGAFATIAPALLPTLADVIHALPMH